MTETMYFISEAAKEVKVENHVLRYWEEELNLPVKRNEQGHRYYTKEDIERFLYVKELKEKGLQLKAIRTILEKQGIAGKDESNGSAENEFRFEREKKGNRNASSQLMIFNTNKLKMPMEDEEEFDDKQEKAYRLQMLLKAMIAEAVSENNRELGNEIKEIIQKEMDYQFRVQEEREEEREKKRVEREEAHFTKIDELLREKISGKRKKHSLW